MRFIHTSSVLIGWSIAASLYSEYCPKSKIFRRQGFVMAMLPPNDVCINAQPITIGSNPNSVITILNMANATVDSDVTDDCLSANNPPVNPGVWFNFTGTGERLIFRSCNNDYFTAVSIFTGGCNPSTLQCVAASNATCDRERFGFETTLGTPYRALFQAKYTSLIHANVSLVNVSIFTAPPVSNDLCIGAQPVTFGLPASGNLTFALSDETDVIDNCQGITPLTDPGVWYSFTGTGGRIKVNPCSGLPIFSRIIVSVYEGGCGPSNLACVAVGRIDCVLNQLIVDTDVGSLYHILINSPSQSTFELLVFPFGQPSIPTAPTRSPRTRAPISAPIRRPRNITFSDVKGDPHITSLDGLEFDCQARGEFTLLKSLNTTFQIQSRFIKASTSDIGSTASVTSGVVIREPGAPTIQISYESRDAATSVQECLGLVELRENGIIQPLLSGTTSLAVSVDIAKQDEIVILFHDTELEIHLLVKSSLSFGCFFTEWIVLPKNFRADETLTGLLGNANGNPLDDWQTTLGNVLPAPDSESALYQGGYDYCRTEWCIRSATDSLFTYDNGSSFTSYFDCDAMYKSDVEDAVAAASPEVRSICGTDIQCIIDGTVGTTADAQSLKNDTVRFNDFVESRLMYDPSLTWSPNTPPRTPRPTIPLPPSPKPVLPMTVPRPVPAPVPIIAPAPPVPTTKPCGLFGLSMFCPFTFGGVIGRFILCLFGRC